jgi:hypothetical protein
MKEELTTKMHSEFQVSEETDLKHRCFSALECMTEFGYSAKDAADIYGVSVTEIDKFRDAFELLSK